MSREPHIHDPWRFMMRAYDLNNSKKAFVPGGQKALFARHIHLRLRGCFQPKSIPRGGRR